MIEFKSKIKSVTGFVGIISVWSLVVAQLSVTWETSEQYAHGYLVPFLCLYLLVKSKPDEHDVNSKPSFFQGKAWIFLGIPAMLTLPLLWVIRCANSDWRMINFALYGVALLLTAVSMYDVGGWRNVKTKLFPLLFFIVAIPWPLASDLQLTQWFQNRISSIIVDMLLLMEHEASLQGTVIDVGVFGQIGVDQACSGINGLQASIVVSLFFGAYYRFRITNRIVLVLAGSVVAVILNLLRAFSLSFIKVKGKGYLLEKHLFSIGTWNFPSLHDLVGFIETGIIFTLIFLLARSARGGLFLKILGNEPTNWKNLKCFPSIIFSSLLILCSIISVGFAEYHFQSRENKLIDLPRLRLAINDSSIISEEITISKQIASQLHFQSANSIQWQEKLKTRFNPLTQESQINPSKEYWQAFEARWESGGACTAVLSTHSPESCLPLTGLTQLSPAEGQETILIPIKVNKKEILFEAYEFSRNYRKLFVFRCFWPYKLGKGEPNLFPKSGYSFNGRIKSTLEGRRNVGGTMLALALANVDSSQVAISKLQDLANNRLSLISN